MPHSVRKMELANLQDFVRVHRFNSREFLHCLLDEQPGSFAVSKNLSKKLYSMMEQFVTREIGDVRDKSFGLAVGQFGESPFKRASMDELRKEWSRLLPRPESALKVPEGQPFLLEMMSQTLEIFGDPDWMILTTDRESFATGVPVGFEKPLPRVPCVS